MLNTIIESFFFWVIFVGITIAAVYIARIAKNMFEYEKQVDRGWNDLIRKADELIDKLNTAIVELQKLKDNSEKQQKNM